MRIRDIALATAASAVLAGSCMAASANAATSAGWVTTYTHHYSLGSTGQTWYQETRTASGKNYFETKSTERRDFSGAGYNETLTRNEPNAPHYWQSVSKESWTAKGKITWSYVVKSA